MSETKKEAVEFCSLFMANEGAELCSKTFNQIMDFIVERAAINLEDERSVSKLGAILTACTRNLYVESTGRMAILIGPGYPKYVDTMLGMLRQELIDAGKYQLERARKEDDAGNR